MRILSPSVRSCLRLLRRLFAPAAALALALAAIAPPQGLAAQEKRWTEVRIASEGARPPYNYIDGNNELAGFEIDLGRDLCARMKVTCRFVSQDWDGLIPGLLNNQYDAVMAALEITDAAREKIAFTKPYVRMPSAFMAAKQSAIADTTPEGLKGKTIGVEAGGAHESYLDDVYGQSNIRPYATIEEAILDLAEGRVDLVIGDKDALMDFLKTRKEAQCCALVGDAPHDPTYFGDGIGVGLRKQDIELKAMFDKALDASVADGSFAKIRAKYFDYKID
ncbi:transporter substrate-binding domain-containing protein [Methylocella sp.]|uniref:transporter substrate-binding domain-containing protein n=1 Tax=Methylocella sp. TaxID=1978226 RepID=UPI003C170196